MKKTKNKILLGYDLKFKDFSEASKFIWMKELSGFKYQGIKSNSSNRFQITFSVDDVDSVLAGCLDCLHIAEEDLKDLRKFRKKNINLLILDQIENINDIKTDIERLKELKKEALR